MQTVHILPFVEKLQNFLVLNLDLVVWKEEGIKYVNYTKEGGTVHGRRAFL
jgi:hypothetical protein